MTSTDHQGDDDFPCCTRDSFGRHEHHMTIVGGYNNDASEPTPPADDVREALIDAMIDVEVSGGMVEFGKDDRAEAAYLADAILADPRFEIRAHRQSTPPADDVLRVIDSALLAHRAGNREDFDAALITQAREEIVRLRGTVAAGRILPASGTSETYVRPRGTVTDAEVNAAGRSIYGATWRMFPADSEAIRAALEAAAKARRA